MRTPARLVEPSGALDARRLAGLLRGADLNQRAVEELLKPESLSMLRVILTDRLPAADDVADTHSEHAPFAGGRVLRFPTDRPLPW